jgi:RNA polymerase-interacting CarD/CdnL/TRCF family regulator
MVKEIRIRSIYENKKARRYDTMRITIPVIKNGRKISLQKGVSNLDNIALKLSIGTNDQNYKKSSRKTVYKPVFQSGKLVAIHAFVRNLEKMDKTKAKTFIQQQLISDYSERRKPSRGLLLAAGLFLGLVVVVVPLATPLHFWIGY